MKYNKKLIWMTILIIVLTFLLTSCATRSGVTENDYIKPNRNTVASGKTNSVTTPSPTPIPDSTIQLKSILSKFTTNDILFFQSYQIGDNVNAAFATVSGGEVWYITDSNAQKLKTGLSFTEGDQSNTTFLWTFDDVTIFKCEDIPGGSSTTSYAWYVKDGDPVALTNTGMNLTYIGNGQFTIIGESFDLDITDGIATGHTYKPYYLYWEDDKLKEYGGLEITQQQLLKLEGAKTIIDVITKSGYAIDEIYYRANDIININYHCGDTNNGNFENVTLKLINKTVIPELVYKGTNNGNSEDFNENNLNDFSYGGIYQKAFFTHIATFADKFDID